MARENTNDFLLEALEDLTLDMFEKFKYKLSYIDYDEMANISKYLLKKANDPVKLADYICDHYGADLAVDVAIYVLERINQRDTAAKLKQEKAKGKGTLVTGTFVSFFLIVPRKYVGEPSSNRETADFNPLRKSEKPKDPRVLPPLHRELHGSPLVIGLPAHLGDCCHSGCTLCRTTCSWPTM